MIAQGDFMKLLMTETKDRLPLFRKIFKTENYKTLQDRVLQAFTEGKKQYEETKVSINTIMGGVQCAEGSELLPELTRAQDSKQFTAIARMIEIIDAILAEDQRSIEEQKAKRAVQEAVITRCNEQIAIIQSHENAAVQLPKEQEKLHQLEQADKPAKEKGLEDAQKAGENIAQLTEQAAMIEGNLGDYQSLADYQTKWEEAQKILQTIEGPQGKEVQCREALKALHEAREKLNAELTALGNPETEQARVQTQLDNLNRYQAELTTLEANRKTLAQERSKYIRLDKEAATSRHFSRDLGRRQTLSGLRFGTPPYQSTKSRRCPFQRTTGTIGPNCQTETQRG